MTDDFDQYEQHELNFNIHREKYLDMKQALVDAKGIEDAPPVVLYYCNDMDVEVWGAFDSLQSRSIIMDELAHYLQPVMITVCEEGWMTAAEAPTKKGELAVRFANGDKSVTEVITSFSICGVPPRMLMSLQPFHYDLNKLVFDEPRDAFDEEIKGDTPSIVAQAYAVSVRSIHTQDFITTDEKLARLRLSEAALPKFHVVMTPNIMFAPEGTYN